MLDILEIVLEMNNQKIIIFDVDEVLTSFGIELLKLVKPKITLNDIERNGNWDVFSLLDGTELKNSHSILEDPYFWYQLKPKESSLYNVAKTREKGHKVLFCTSPWTNCKVWDNIRRKWLKENFDALGREDIIITAAKEFVYGDIFIDDKPSTVKKWYNRWNKFECKALLYESVFNINDPEALNIYPRIKVAVDNKWAIIESNNTK